MVLRLFVPPGEGQHLIVPKRPDPLGANATLQYSVVASTTAAAGYAYCAARYTRRIAPHSNVSRTALFVKASGTLGLWAVAVGAAANAYYHKNFTSVVVSQTVRDPTPPKLYEKTDKYTAEDGCLAGAALGFAAFLPTLFMRRLSVSWWTRMVGMTNIGACTGVLASHAYFHYTGERQKALEELKWLGHRRNLEFHHIFWDKLLMTQFDPLIQSYIRHKGIFSVQLLPEEAYDAPEIFDRFGAPAAHAESNHTATEAPSTDAPPAIEQPQYYNAAPDWTHHLKTMDVAFVQSEIEACERDKAALLKEAEYLAYTLTQKQYDFVNDPPPSEDDRQTLLRELQLMTAVYNRLRLIADDLDRRSFARKLWVRQRAAMDAGAARSAWLAACPSVDPETHDARISIAEMKKFEEQFKGEISVFEARMSSQAREDVERRDRFRRDLEDARIMLRAVDRVSWELERNGKGAGKTRAEGERRSRSVPPSPPGGLGPGKA